jgi:hypothetical protein
MALEIDGAMQQAAHPGRQSIGVCGRPRVAAWWRRLSPIDREAVC